MTTVSLFATLLVAAGAGQVDRVVLMADRAEVTRVRQVGCDEGKAEAAFFGLPRGLDHRALRAEAAGGAEVLGLSHAVVPLTEDRDQRVAKLRSEIERLDVTLSERGTELGMLNQRAATIGGYGAHFLALWREEIRNPDTRGAEQWTAALDRMLAERLALSKKTERLHHQRRELGRRRDAFARQLGHLRPDDAPEAVDVTVALRCTNKTEVALTYVVPGATWRPEYDLRFEPETAGKKVGAGKVTLTVGAVVEQATGEDWDDVRLMLSTSKPRLGSDAPRPARIRVYGGEREEGRILVEATESRKQLLTRAGGKAGPATVAAFEDRGQSFALELRRRVTIKADGRPYWNPVETLTASGTSKLVAVPKLRAYVFRAVELDNPAPFALLGGTVHAYRTRGGSESYVGDTELTYKGPGEPMEISLGIDEEVRVTREELEEPDEAAGTFDSTQTLKRGYRIGLTNNGEAATTVEVRENIPVSKSEEIEVTIDNARTTRPHVLDAHQGFVIWTVELNEGATKKLEIAYGIALPEAWQVSLH